MNGSVTALVGLLALQLVFFVAIGCGGDPCEQAAGICRATATNGMNVEGGVNRDADCGSEDTECLASCVADANSCSQETLARCRDICAPFLTESD